MQIGVIGINYKLADVALREVLAHAFQKKFGLSNELKSFVLLSTCNRVELYFSGHDLAVNHQYILAALKEEIALDFDQKCYSFFGADCFLHLAKVTSGLDSAILHESEIQHQVKVAYEQSAHMRSLDSELHFLFQKSLKIAKNVRTEFPIPRTALDLEHVVLLLINYLFREKPSQILFIGASEINCKIAKFLAKKNAAPFTFATRHGHEMLETIAHSSLPWNELQSSWGNFPVVIAASKQPTYLLTEAPLPQKKRLLLDLAVPRNISPKLSTAAGGQLFNIDDLNLLLKERKIKLQHLANQAENYIQIAIEKQLSIIYEKSAFA